MTFLPGLRRRNLSPVFGLRSEMDKLLEDFFDGVLGEKRFMSSPSVDVSENDSVIEVHVELPGVDAESVTVNADERILSIQGEKKVERDEKQANWHIVERSHGSFARTIELPAEVDSNKAKASYKDGVLTVTLPKREEAKPRKVAIKVE